MGWIKRPHQCKTPDRHPLFRRAITGDKWRCGNCRTVWRLQIVSPTANTYRFRWIPVSRGV